MKRLLVLSLAIMLFAIGNAQTGGGKYEGKVLNSKQLAQEKWYYSLDEARLDPDNVYKLSLEGQKLKTLPEDFLIFRNLQVLNLEGNKLKDLPENFGDLKNLQFLNLYDNKLKTLPVSMKQLGNLVTLYLGKNDLVELPLWVGGMGKLIRLDISKNPMTPRELQYVMLRLPNCEVTY